MSISSDIIEKMNENVIAASKMKKDDKIFTIMRVASDELDYLDGGRWILGLTTLLDFFENQPSEYMLYITAEKMFTGYPELVLHAQHISNIEECDLSFKPLSYFNTYFPKIMSATPWFEYDDHSLRECGSFYDSAVVGENVFMPRFCPKDLSFLPPTENDRVLLLTRPVSRKALYYISKYYTCNEFVNRLESLFVFKYKFSWDMCIDVLSSRISCFGSFFNTNFFYLCNNWDKLTTGTGFSPRTHINRIGCSYESITRFVNVFGDLIEKSNEKIEKIIGCDIIRKDPLSIMKAASIFERNTDSFVQLDVCFSYLKQKGCI